MSVNATAVVLPAPAWSLRLGDALELLSKVPSESVDLVITDPPYASLEKHRLHPNGTHRGRIPRLVQWFPVVPNAYYVPLFSELHRVLRKGRHCYVFSDSETMFAMRPAAEAAGFKFWKPIVWDKELMGMGYHYRARCEFILFLEKGKRRLKNLGVPDVLRCPRIRRKGGYPTEKPVELQRTLITQSSNPGEIVLDPFCGSASSGEAALVEGREFVGFDSSELAVSTAKSRLSLI